MGTGRTGTAHTEPNVPTDPGATGGVMSPVIMGDVGRWGVLTEPTVAILLLASVVHVVRRDMVDLAVFAGTAVLIIVDSRRGPRQDDGARDEPAATTTPGSGGRTLPTAAVLLPVAALWSAVPPAADTMRLLLVLTGVTVAVLVIAAPRPAPATRPRPRGWPWWAAIGIAASLWELQSFIWQQVAGPQAQQEHPALSDLIEPLLAGWSGRAVFLLLWMSAGWWLLRRTATLPVMGTARAGRREGGRQA